MLSFFLPSVSVRRGIFSLFATLYLCFVLGCSGGQNSSSIPAAPSSLVYPQTAITVIVGQSITGSTPSVTGTVSSYSISPALPAGLTLNPSTGVISGTPTAAIPATTFTITASNSGGSTTTTIQLAVNVPAPTGLTYPQTIISAMVGVAIASDVPTVTGTVVAYTASPALPAGLNLNSTTGAITGTPTTAVTQATYVVSATNASGSTSASLQIVVAAAVAAPSSLAYPQGSVSATVGEPIIPNIPSFTGTVTSFTVSPALPVGLGLDSGNGTISGTPTSILGQTSYTVTASNAGGSTTATVVLSVGKAYVSLMDLGHGSAITAMRSASNRILSQDQSGHWVLWDSSSNAKVASGDQYFLGQSVYWPIDIAGSSIAIGQSNGVEVRSSSDGHLLSLIASPTMIDPVTSFGRNAWWKLASDGSYLCAGSSAGLSVWSSTGQQMFQRQGDYSKANVFAAPDQIQVALGAAGSSVIETIAVSTGASATSPAFFGTFNSWFLDGQRFLTSTGTTVWTYSAAGVQQGIVALQSGEIIAGQGNWISVALPIRLYPSSIAIYEVGANSPSATYATANGTQFFASGTTIGLVNDHYGSGSIVDLSASAPSKSDFTTPFAFLSSYTATSAAKWYVSNEHGVIADGSSPNVAGALDLGQAWSIAGGTTRAAIATANGTITYLNPVQLSSNVSIAFSSSKVALSADDTVLAAVANLNDSAYSPDRTLNFYSMPSGTLVKSLPNQLGDGSNLERIDFSLAGSGTFFGQIFQRTDSRAIQAMTGSVDGTTSFALPATSNQPIEISPDGSLVSISSGQVGLPAPTSPIYKNGALVGGVTGGAIGWLDDNTLLTNIFDVDSVTGTSLVYKGAVIYNAAGVQQATSAIPLLNRIQVVTSDQIYSPEKNAIFSLATGQPVWTATKPSTNGAVVGSSVVFASGSQVFVDSH
ncbi:MAG: Ig domain-containing protein [Edaphobacter sp.]|uniref:beta strand repeat-containing protein n=1 Tax=Edaphobacter sp. TaxID=1934404 RepID=UPI00239EBDD7|nr:Ig domain-containing protein [Edaphobacter sp.]MDE1176897.1 Ig domain-containing protein [Edaphobacter sp.]